MSAWVDTEKAFDQEFNVCETTKAKADTITQ
jgi:hypothetical protein